MNNNKATKRQKISLKLLLCKTIRYGTVQDVQRFRWFSDSIENNNNANKKGKSKPNEEPLFVVMEKQDAKMYHEVFKFNLDLDCRVGTHSMTALHYAVETGNTLAVAMFLYYGLDPDALTTDNNVPVKLATSRNMRNVFSDFKQMARANFAKKYKLKIPRQTSTSKPFPFLALPPEIQEQIWQCVSLVNLWNFQFVSKEWREYFQRKTNANSLANNLFPRGQLSPYTAISYYPTEYHFSFANRLCDLTKDGHVDLSQIIDKIVRENKKDGRKLSPQIKAIIKLLQDKSGSSSDFKEKIFTAKSLEQQRCYYIQKSTYFGIAIEVPETPILRKLEQIKLMRYIKQFAQQ